MILLLALACSDYSVREAPPDPPADPPADETHPFGDPPDWNSCKSGLMARYSNLASDHPDVQDELVLDTGGIDTADTGWQPLEPEDVDWWDEIAFSSFEPSLEYGPGWAPVDEGLEDDPRFFAVRWEGWLRVTRNGDVPFVLGASTDAWVRVGPDTVARLSGSAYEPETHSANLRTGQYPFEILYAHRAGDELGFRFRFTNDDDVQLCPGIR